MITMTTPAPYILFLHLVQHGGVNLTTLASPSVSRLYQMLRTRNGIRRTHTVEFSTSSSGDLDGGLMS